MNYGISVLFRAIPLLMGIFCFAYGAFIVLHGHDEARLVAGPVVFSLGMICIALFCTAATIIRQIIHTYNKIAMYGLPILGYSAALITIIVGLMMVKDAHTTPEFVAGHVVTGVGFIASCVATAATSSAQFFLIPINSKSIDEGIPDEAFSKPVAIFLISIPTLAAIITWSWALVLLSHEASDAKYFIAGHVMAGLACICTSLIALVASIVRQIRNVYNALDKRLWIYWVLTMGAIATLWGLYVIFMDTNETTRVIGFIVIALGMVCFSISSKVILLAKVWKGSFALANRIPLIPVFTALACLFLSSFMFELVSLDAYYYIPARVISGLGAICFTLFSIVSILESGTSQVLVDDVDKDPNLKKAKTAKKQATQNAQSQQVVNKTT